jgi:hypothetical protein
MSDQKEASGKEANGKRLAVYAINEKEGERTAWWQKIGVAFTNRDGSIAIYLDALPIGTNKLQIREQRDEVRAGASPASTASSAGNGAARRGEEARP